MQPQHARVLALLVEHAGEVVTRDEFRRALWPEDVFVDFDHGLSKAVNHLRELLCDSTDLPRFIQTLPRIGYRFIAAVEVAAPITARDGEVHNKEEGPVDRPRAASAAPAVPQEVTNYRLLRTRRLWASAATAVVAAAACLVAIVLLGAKAHPKIALSASDWVLVSDFENRTGDPALDGVLQPALERELDNSLYVHVVPRERVYDVLRLMRKPSATVVDEATGREICLRDGGIKLIVTGRADRLGSNYVLGVSIVDPQTGTTLHSASAQARGEADVLAAIHRLGDDIRSALGEELPQIRITDQQFAKVTTPSLEALKLFTAGYNFQIEGDNEGALPFFRDAVKSDPSFATAWVYLGWAQHNVAWEALNVKGRGKPVDYFTSFRRAFQLAGEVSERERLFILESWYMMNHQLNQAIEAGEQLVKLYPDHYWGANNLAILLWGAGRAAEALQVEKLCMNMRPSTGRALSLWSALRQTDPQQAQSYLQLARTLATREPQSAYVVQTLDARLAWQRSDAQAISKNLTAIQPASRAIVAEKALGLAAMGKLSAAEQLEGTGADADVVSFWTAFLRHGREGVRSFALTHPAAPNFASLLLFVRFGSNENLKKQLANPNLALPIAIPPSFRKTIEEALQGEISLAHGKFVRAAALLTSAIHDGSRDAFLRRANPVFFDPAEEMILADSLATAYEDMGNDAAALATLQTYDKTSPKYEYNSVRWWPPPMPPVMLAWPMVQQHLADLYRKTGNTVRADAIERELASLLSLADSDYSLEAQRGGPASGTTMARVHKER